MKINLIIFGELSELVGQKLILQDIPDTNYLNKILQEKYPVLANKKYVMVVNKNQVTENTSLNDGYTVALLPPFSGG